MMSKIIASFFLLTIATTCFSQTDTLVQRLFLIGDAGELQGNTQMTLDWLKKNVNWDDEKNIALFLGDNIYPDGLPDEGDAQYPYTKMVIDYQVNMFKGKKAKAFFVPGNHDWKGGKIGGWERAVNQINYINSMQAPNIQAWPLNGCPGPIPVELNEKIVLVMMNTQWFLHVHDKPGPESSCEARSIDEFTAELQQIVDTHPNQLLILVMHHPMYTYGTHGGAYGLKQHIFPFADAIKGAYIPLPVIGSAYPLARGLFGSLQDTYHPLYQTMINEIEQVLKKHPNPIAVAGHEHSLQLIVKDSIPYIVSGSAAKLTRLRKGKNSLFSILDYGFAVLEIRKSGQVEVKFYNLQTPDLSKPLYTKILKAIITTTATPVVDTLFPILGQVNTTPGVVRSSRLEKMLWGNTYQAEWAQKINLSMLDLGNEAGGLKPVRQQGGSRTRILNLSEKKGKEWTLRSIEPFPESVIPADLRNGANTTRIYGTYPYAALSLPFLENAANIPTLKRKLLYVPDDPRLERFRTGFKNTLALLEEKEPTYAGKTFTTEELFLLLIKENKDKIDQKSVLNARLMDNFVMDFDRHEGKWRWATRDTGRGKLYFPVPYDHDHAFFNSDGLLTTWLRQSWFMPELQGFRAKAYNIKTFNKAARNFDRTFLTELSAADWEVQIDSFLAHMSDDVITSAIKQQPAEVQNLSGPSIIEQLKKRKQYLKNEMLDYYRFISRTVSVTGTNQRDYFLIRKMENGNVLITAHKLESDGSISAKLYERMFDPRVTKELRLYALEADDSLVIAGENTRIRIRVIGGPGNDHFRNKGNGDGVMIYDAAFEKNVIAGNPGLKNKILPEPEINRFSRLDFRYNYWRPAFKMEYNKDDGIRLGIQIEHVKQGFRKDPFSMYHSIKAEKFAGTGAYRFSYEGIITKIFKNVDLNIQADIRAPLYVTNFFGLGNNTEVDPVKSILYYRARYDITNLSLLAGKQLQSWMRVGFGPSFQYLSIRAAENRKSFIEDNANGSLNPASLFKDQLLLGAEARIDINSKNSVLLPTRGALLKAYARQLFGLNHYSNSIFQTGLDLRIFMSFSPQPRFVLATRFGAGGNFGNFTFQQSQYLSGTENLRGYRRERFAGRSMFYNNTELRARLFNYTTFIFEGAAGLIAFHDIGRVWAKDEKSARWHNGYGAGVWIAPIRRILLVGSLSFSKEETAMPLFTFGFQF